MERNGMLNDIAERLNKLSIYDLRQVGRAVGVHRPADGKKSRVIEAVLGIAEGKIEPEPRTLRGAPPKSQQFDEQLVADILACRAAYLSADGAFKEVDASKILKVSDSGVSNEEIIFGGVLDLSGGVVFLRNFNGAEVFVHDAFIKRFSLREGDFIECKARSRNGEGAGLAEVISVNGLPCDLSRERLDFDALTRTYPQTNVKTAYPQCGAALKMIDVFSPLALGQRAVVCAPSKAGKTTLLKQIGGGICRNYPDLKLIILLVSESPEEITDFKRALPDAELIYTTFDMDAESHVRAVRLGLEYAKRQVEYGKDVVMLFDGISRFKQAAGGACDCGSLIKRLLSSACNFEQGGSFTLISTLASDRAADGNLFEEVCSLANMRITLDGELAAKRIFPAIDAGATFADRDETFLTETEAEFSAAVRANLGGDLSAAALVNSFKKYSSLQEISAEIFKR